MININTFRLLIIFAALLQGISAVTAAAAPIQSPANECDVLLSTIGKKNTYVNSAPLTSNLSFPDLVKNIQNKDQLRWTYSNLFLDRDRIAIATNRENSDLASMWDEPHYIFFKKSPLENFKSAYEDFILKNSTLTEEIFTTERINEFHRAMMKNGVEGISTSAIGKIRTTPVMFLTNSEILKKTRLQLIANPFLSIGNPDSFGRIIVEYPAPTRVKYLLDTALSNHHETIRNSKTLTERVRAHTDFVWSFVSIHPFENGNGRTSRFILDYLLAKEGLSPPLLSDTIDLTVTKDQYFEKVLLGVKNADLFAADIAWRIAEGLDPLQSPYNLAAKLPAQIWFASEGTKKVKVPFIVDLYDYAQFVRERIKSTLAPGNEISFLKDYVVWLKKWSVQFADRTGGLQPYQVRRVPNEIIDLWKNSSGKALKNKDSLKLFYKNFYEDSSLYRGLSLGRTVSDAELVDYFKTVKGIDLSVNAAQKGGTLTDILSDFNKFNELMNQPEKLFEYTRDHMNAEGLYGVSPFTSTSKTSTVADRFSRGFMMDSRWITSMQGQLLVGMYRPKYGVMDLNRLREISGKNTVDDPFKSRYPRQQEVSVAGSIHPASINRVEFRDVRVLESVENSGEQIAGKTEIKLIRILTRLIDDPTKVLLEKFDQNKNLISSEIISLY